MNWDPQGLSTRLAVPSRPGEETDPQRTRDMRRLLLYPLLKIVKVSCSS